MSRFAKFKINANSLPVEDVKPYAKKEGEKAWKMKPGLHDNCIISAVEDRGDSDKDPTWFKLFITLQEFKAEIRYLVMVPTNNLLFGPEKKDFAIKNLMKFTEALGIKLTKDNASIVIPALFSEPEKLIGLRIGVQVGHKAHYATKENNQVIVRDKNDKPLLSEDGVNPIVFPDFAAAEMFCKDKGLEFSVFPEVKYLKSPKEENDPRKLDALLTAQPEVKGKKKKSVDPF